MSILLFVDVETTGTDPMIHEVIEIGAILGELTFDRHWRHIGELSRKILPQHLETSDPEALAINGYKPEDWAAAALPRAALKALDDLLSLTNERVVMAGHNVQFDHGFLRAAYHKTELPWPSQLDYRMLDTMSLAAPLWLWGFTKNGSASLDAVCAYFNIHRPSPHRAFQDAAAALDITLRMAALSNLHR